MDFSSSSGGLGGAGGAGGAMDASQRDNLMNEIKAQMAIVNAQELLQKMSDKCFKKCVTRPGASLDSSEQKCIGNCMDRYMDTWNLVSRTYSSRLQKERNKMS